ncbi:MAG: restriction endonuclease [Candidatus Korobacteraceae bacterium]
MTKEAPLAIIETVMHPLYQRLRELDWDTFQRLAFQLIAERHPGLNIRHVEGAGGDRGLDLFEGRLKDQPAIWQCKQFPNGLGPKQRPQVKESLRAALKYFNPKQWVLVVSIDLDRKAHEWFQKLQQSYAQRTAIGLFQASDIVRELIYRRNLRDAFFPGAVVDTVMVRRAIQGLGEPTSDELSQLANGQLDELIARLEAVDGRFNYQIVHGPNVGADIASATQPHPLLIASVFDQDKRINVFARDLEAITLDPPKINFTLKGSGVAKFQEFLRTGRRQEFETDEVSTPTSTLDFILPQKEVTGWKLVVMPAVSITNKILSLRVTFSSSSEQIRYELVQFRVSSAGNEQADIESTSPLPFVLSFTLPLIEGKEGSFSVQERFEGAGVQAVAKAIRAISALRTGGSVELYALEIEKPLGTLNALASMSAEREKWEQVILDAARVSEIYNANLRVPARIGVSDLRTLALLMAIAQGEQLPIDSFNAKLIKSAEHEAVVASAIDRKLEVVAEKLELVAEFPKLDPSPVVFGTGVDTGPVSLYATGAAIDDAADFVARYKKADYGEPVPVRFTFSEVRAQLGTGGNPHIFIRPAQLQGLPRIPD